jgi:hypothetical protein
LIRQDTAEQPKDNDWRKANKPKESELQRFSSKLVDLPSDRDSLHLRAQGRDELGRPKQPIVSMPEHGKRSMSPAVGNCGLGDAFSAHDTTNGAVSDPQLVVRIRARVSNLKSAETLPQIESFEGT